MPVFVVDFDDIEDGRIALSGLCTKCGIEYVIVANVWAVRTHQSIGINDLDMTSEAVEKKVARIFWPGE